MPYFSTQLETLLLESDTVRRRRLDGVGGRLRGSPRVRRLGENCSSTRLTREIIGVNRERPRSENRTRQAPVIFLFGKKMFLKKYLNKKV